MIGDHASLDFDHYAHNVTMTFKVNDKAQYKLDIRIEGMYEQCIIEDSRNCISCMSST